MSTHKNLAMNIVNQLADLWGVPVEVRQNTNDQADKFVQALINTATREGAIKELNGIPVAASFDTIYYHILDRLTQLQGQSGG